MATTIENIWTPVFQRMSTWFRPLLYSLIGVISINVMVHHNLDMVADQVKSVYGDREDTFDFVIVGGGSAGSVLANRLSQDFKVLLLEAGGNPSPLSSMPALAFLMLRQPFIDWRYYTTPQKNSCLGMNNNQCYWPRGKGLGGSSNLNFLIFLRGHKKDYDNWANITGDESWNYENVVNFFKKHENYQYNGPWDEQRRKYHAQGGEMNVEQPPYTGMARHFVNAGQELGYNEVDLNGPFDEGFETHFFSQRYGSRFGTYRAFIEPILKERKSLTIYKFSMAHSIIFGPDNEAIGVEYVRHGIRKQAFATKEVIVSAGAINSPQLLMLSGIGPRKQLESFGIKVRRDLPVGQNLQDHVTSFMGPFSIEKDVSMNLDRDLNPSAFYDFVHHGTGALTSPGVQASGFLASSYAKAAGEELWPDTQLMMLGTSIYNKAPKDFEFAFNVRDGVLHKYYSEVHNKESFQIITVLARPKSRGEVTLQSLDPNVPPLMNPNYFGDRRDVEVLLEGMKMTIQIVENTTTFRSMGGRFQHTLFPGCERHPPRSDAYLECYLRHMPLTMYHPTCTCPMGRPDSPHAVVDSELRVLGTQRLRVIDASIMPEIVSSNPNAASLMIGEKGADIVRRAHISSINSKLNNNEIQ